MLLEKVYPNVKTRWLADLRSGQFTQTKGVLRDAQGYCCLGVLCEQFKDEFNAEWKGPYPDGGRQTYNLVGDEFCEDTLPPDEILEHTGLSRHGDAVSFLTSRNDGSPHANLNPNSERWDFLQTADWIEANL